MKSLVIRFTKINARNVRRAVVIVTKRFGVIDRLIGALNQCAAAGRLWYLAALGGLDLSPVLHPASSAAALYHAAGGGTRRPMAARMLGRRCSGLARRPM